MFSLCTTGGSERMGRMGLCGTVLDLRFGPHPGAATDVHTGLPKKPRDSPGGSDTQVNRVRPARPVDH